MEMNRSPRFLENPPVRLPGSWTPAGSNPPCHSGRFDTAPAIWTAEAPTTMAISELYHPAFALAVYASQGGSPHHHARLASGCRLSSTGWDWLPTGFQRKVSECILTSHPPYPGFAWRNQIKAVRNPAPKSPDSRIHAQSGEEVYDAAGQVRKSEHDGVRSRWLTGGRSSLASSMPSVFQHKATVNGADRTSSPRC